MLLGMYIIDMMTWWFLFWRSAEKHSWLTGPGQAEDMAREIAQQLSQQQARQSAEVPLFTTLQRYLQNLQQLQDREGTSRFLSLPSSRQTASALQ
jgi:hypothetical protein